MAVKVFRSDQLDAPLMTGQLGSAIDLLDAILVNGYGQVNVTSIGRVSSTATVTTADPHGFETGDYALIGGATESEYNGEFLVTKVDATTFTIAVSGEPATPATGAITSKRAPAGFSKPFEGVNKAVYRSNDLSSRRHYLRVLDNGSTGGAAKEAQIWAYEEMTDVDTGTHQYPNGLVHNEPYFFIKAYTTNTQAYHWLCVTDGKTVYFFSYFRTNTEDPTYSIANIYSYHSSWGFGDVISFRAGDPYASFITGSKQNEFSSDQHSGLFNSPANSSTVAGTASTTVPAITFARNFTGVPAPIKALMFGATSDSTVGARVSLPYPSPIDNGFWMTPCLISQSDPSCFRGRMPGFYEPLHSKCFPNSTVIENVQGYPGRKFMMLYGKNGRNEGCCMVDITGPWDS